ncbi:MAG TPA: hypothetical protein VHP38_13135 [Ruminiclostridium sp.]|nr:hypothetical protein [Ruminiclostridium sp.]
MSKQTSGQQPDIECAKCGIRVSLGKVTVSYLGTNFPVELYKCSECGMVFIPEELATGKMEQVEKALEDK